jgi:hypothetical protein
MSIDIRENQLTSQAPSHTSPAGRRIIDDTIAELLAEYVIDESESPCAERYPFPRLLL